MEVEKVSKEEYDEIVDISLDDKGEPISLEDNFTHVIQSSGVFERGNGKSVSFKFDHFLVPDSRLEEIANMVYDRGSKVVYHYASSGKPIEVHLTVLD